MMVLPVVLGLQLAMAGANPMVTPVQSGVPNLDSARSCRAEAAGSLGFKEDVNSCLKTEQDMRSQLTKTWSEFVAADRNTCVGLSSMGGQATYTELLTCLEMLRDARKLPKDTGTVGLGRSQR
jgi:hypothetical protein